MSRNALDWPARYPPAARCAVDACGHRYDQHDDPPPGHGVKRCLACFTSHEFEPLKLAGGALTADQEREAYERAMRGEP